MTSFDDVQPCLQGSALVLHLLMMGISRRLVELNDHVHRGTVMVAFDSIKLFGQLMLFAVGKGRTGCQQYDQGQEREPRAPCRCFQDGIAGWSLCSRRKGHELGSWADWEDQHREEMRLLAFSQCREY